MTIIQDLGMFQSNHIWIKREDLLPFSFGGNKARKAQLFFREIEKGEYNCVVTYGSGSSNHSRVVANECCRRKMSCNIICPEEASDSTFNSQMLKLFGAEVTIVPITKVHETIENKLSELRGIGKKPYFIEGGGHGDIGTEAYVQCYREICEQERELKVHFDYIFFASGTGTTQAGLVCGQLINNDSRKIIGISIARKNPRGRDVVIESIRSYLNELVTETDIQNATHFIDEYTTGYGQRDDRVQEVIDEVLRTYGIPMDMVYTGKAFMGMRDYLGNVRGANVLFIHTGGTPLFFDMLNNRV